MPTGAHTRKAKHEQLATCLATTEHVAVHITDEAVGIPLQRYAKNATPNCRIPQGLGVPGDGDNCPTARYRPSRCGALLLSSLGFGMPCLNHRAGEEKQAA